MLISAIDLVTSANQTATVEGFGNDRRCFMILDWTGMAWNGLKMDWNGLQCTAMVRAHFLK